VVVEKYGLSFSLSTSGSRFYIKGYRVEKQGIFDCLTYEQVMRLCGQHV
jgi:hypothetical protein